MDNALRDLNCRGLAPAKEQQKRYGEIAARLSELGNQYSNNALDATMGWSKLVTDVAELSGMPESALAAAQAQAQAKEQEGYLLTLDIPSYLPVMTYCDNQGCVKSCIAPTPPARRTRAECRQMGQQPGDGRNSRAAPRAGLQLLGFDSYASKSLSTKMAENPQQGCSTS